MHDVDAFVVAAWSGTGSTCKHCATDVCVCAFAYASPLLLVAGLCVTLDARPLNVGCGVDVVVVAGVIPPGIGSTYKH